jgi:VanZ family protein
VPLFFRQSRPAIEDTRSEHPGFGSMGKLAIFFPSVLVVLVIATAGTQRFSIENTAGLLAPFWFRHFGTLPYQRYWEFVEAVRKLGHMIGYGLACLAFFATSYWLLSLRPSQLFSNGGWLLKNRAAGWALLLTGLLGSADELHQRFVPQRTSTVTDVGFDICGGYFALMILFAALRFRERKTSVQAPPALS